MIVKRIVTNLAAKDPAAAKAFYGTLLGLDMLMDMGSILTFGSDQEQSVQLSVASEGGSGTPVPDLSIEVDDLDEALAKRSPSCACSKSADCAIRAAAPGAQAFGLQ